MNQLRRHRVHRREHEGAGVDDAGAGLERFMQIPFEFAVTSNYGHRKDVPVYPVDMDLFSFLRLRKTEELFSPTNLDMLLAERTGEEVTPGFSSEETMVRLFVQWGLKPGGYTLEMYIRDTYMIQKIQTLMKYYGSRIFLHVTGWRHLQDPYGLFSPLNPTRILCHDETLCF